MFKSKTKKRQEDSRGFTLLELMISVFIIGLITSIAVFNQSDLSDQVALSNLTNDIELQIREAQVYGISVKEFAPGDQEFTIPYGVDFNLGTGGNNTSYYNFGDRSPTVNGYYDAWGTCSINSSSECVAYNLISRGDYIQKLCVIQSDNTEACSPTSISRLAIVFNRPNPAAVMTFFNSSNVIVTFSGYKGAKIYVASPKGLTKSITVYKTGQVSTQ